jgi:hypothetical protein
LQERVLLRCIGSHPLAASPAWTTTEEGTCPRNIGKGFSLVMELEDPSRLPELMAKAAATQ